MGVATAHDRSQPGPPARVSQAGWVKGTARACHPAAVSSRWRRPWCHLTHRLGVAPNPPFVQLVLLQSLCSAPCRKAEPCTAHRVEHAHRRCAHRPRLIARCGQFFDDRPNSTRLPECAAGLLLPNLLLPLLVVPLLVVRRQKTVCLHDNLVIQTHLQRRRHKPHANHVLAAVVKRCRTPRAQQSVHRHLRCDRRSIGRSSADADARPTNTADTRG